MDLLGLLLGLLVVVSPAAAQSSAPQSPCGADVLLVMIGGEQMCGLDSRTIANGQYNPPVTCPAPYLALSYSCVAPAVPPTGTTTGFVCAPGQRSIGSGADLQCESGTQRIPANFVLACPDGSEAVDVSAEPLECLTTESVTLPVDRESVYECSFGGASEDDPLTADSQCVEFIESPAPLSTVPGCVDPAELWLVDPTYEFSIGYCRTLQSTTTVAPVSPDPVECPWELGASRWRDRVLDESGPDPLCIERMYTSYETIDVEAYVCQSLVAQIEEVPGTGPGSDLRCRTTINYGSVTWVNFRCPTGATGNPGLHACELTVPAGSVVEAVPTQPSCPAGFELFVVIPPVPVEAQECFGPAYVAAQIGQLPVCPDGSTRSTDGTYIVEVGECRVNVAPWTFGEFPFECVEYVTTDDGQCVVVVGDPQPNCGGVVATINLNVTPGASGTSGDDVIVGTSGPDVINGFGGHDTICGLGGNDTIAGGDGNDVVFAGGGDDFVSGGAGKDRIRGQNGDDIINGGSGNDNLNGNNGDDIVNGGDGHDFVSGRDGSDTVTGGPGNDTVLGGGKTDVVKGGSGNDTMSGNGFADEMFGGRGDDVMNGGDGPDHLRGEQGNDTLAGGRGNYILWGGNGDDDCDGKTGWDTQVNCEDLVSIP